jgi:hypothetical protein
MNLFLIIKLAMCLLRVKMVMEEPGFIPQTKQKCEKVVDHPIPQTKHL